jgi:hypothetical protein
VGDSIFLIVPQKQISDALIANLCSVIFDFTARQSIGGENASFFLVKQLPVLTAATCNQLSSWSGGAEIFRDWALPRVLELSYTAWDLEPFAQACGWTGPPFRWDNERRFLIRCELDAAFFHLYLPVTNDYQWKPARVADGAVHDESQEELAELKRHFATPRDAVAYIMDTFPIIRRKDEEKHGEYRTKRTILEIYDAMQESIYTGKSYQTRLDPPPGPPEIDLHEWKPGHSKPVHWPSHIHPPKGCEDA